MLLLIHTRIEIPINEYERILLHFRSNYDEGNQRCQIQFVPHHTHHLYDLAADDLGGQ